MKLFKFTDSGLSVAPRRLSLLFMMKAYTARPRCTEYSRIEENETGANRQLTTPIGVLFLTEDPAAGL